MLDHDGVDVSATECRWSVIDDYEFICAVELIHNDRDGVGVLLSVVLSSVVLRGGGGNVGATFY